MKTNFRQVIINILCIAGILAALNAPLFSLEYWIVLLCVMGLIVNSSIN